MAITHTLDTPQTYGNNRVYLDAQIPTNGAADPVAANCKGGFYTVARTGVGILRFTFKQGFRAGRPRVFPELQLAVPDGSYAVAGPFTAATATAEATLDIHIRAASGAAVELPAANANNVLSLGLTFTDTGVPVPA